MSELAKREEKILEFWNKEKIFEKSLQKPAPKGEFIFYDGPPFANGLPHYGHILASAIKDAIPRYRTMTGYRVPRQWGWDCHGLPVENLVEKELGLKAKRDIEAYGVEKFNAAARTSIMKDVADWKRIIPRIGRWADMEADYKTMDASYTQSVWWAFKNLYDRGLVYEGFKAMHLCPRCGTTLSNFEVAQGYLDIEDFAVTVKLPLVDDPDTSLLIWTTTPWTLPGNPAAAVKADAEYVKVKVGGEYLITAEGKLEGEVVKKYKGSELVGKKYLPPFDYFATELHKHKTHLWKVYAADYVTMEDGTGIVHLAPAYGADDLALAQKNKIPLIHHVTDEGKFIATVRDFAGMPVKPKGRHLETDAKIVEYLREKGLLFKDEKIKHSYPHCWRCDTPLLNWAATSWFVNVQKIKGNLLKQNATVGWVPAHVGEGRFGKWLEGARDWAVSRGRYWGAPVPVWRNEKTKEVKIVGSVTELLSIAKRSGNRYFVMRHGEALSNVRDVDDLSGDPENHLTEKGINAVKHAALDLKKEQIDFIVVSPFIRTRETAAIVQGELGLPDKAVVVDERMREGGSHDSAGVRQRVGQFIFEVEQRYVNKNILFVSHGYPLWVLNNIAGHKMSDLYTRLDLPELASVCELLFTPFPHNADYELDLHRPYIDDFATGEWRRDKDVFDCWFESGSMPFAGKGYPLNKTTFDPKKFFGYAPRGYPADFIAEGTDQTRGWFYSLIVLGTALFGRTPYKNVIVNGIITASDGQKMSKRLRNYPDPMEVVEKYGADSLRYFLLSSSVVRAEDLRFNERGVEEVGKKLLMRLDNVRSFYDLYAGAGKGLTLESPELRSDLKEHVLDRWIFSRLGQLVKETTQGFERYELDIAARPLGAFIDDLSTWYLRRSRDRFKTEGPDKAAALATLREVLMVTSKVMAPLMPFFADDLYRRLRAEGEPESVHLCDWPAAPAVDEKLIADMAAVRQLASKGLELREKAGIKVRQPLGAFETAVPVVEELAAILKDELNVKEIKYNPDLKENRLATELTAELKEEGMYRDYVRTIQEWRKEQKFSIADRPGLLIKTNIDLEFLKKFKEVLKEATGLLSLEVKESESVQLERL
ncbi:MAG: class I tRNA ligase family protein [Patescibacteria group bacterium]